jgi:hypothetical protein
MEGPLLAQFLPNGFIGQRPRVKAANTPPEVQKIVCRRVFEFWNNFSNAA